MRGLLHALSWYDIEFLLQLTRSVKRLTMKCHNYIKRNENILPSKNGGTTL